MSAIEAIVEGTLKPTARWNWTQRPNLPPGRVTVIVQPKTSAPG